MRIAVMSDSHDNIWNLRRALDVVAQRKAAMIVHCGDFVAPFVFKELQMANVPVHGVFGNNDGDRFLLTKMSLADGSRITLHGMAGEIDIGGFSIGFAHERLIADGLLRSGKFDLVCYGHSHTYSVEAPGQTILLNPGEIMGKDGTPGFVLFDTETRTHERIRINEL